MGESMARVNTKFSKIIQAGRHGAGHRKQTRRRILHATTSLLLVTLASLVFTSASIAAIFEQHLTFADFTNFGYVDEQNALSYEHTFEPLQAVGSINNVYLGVTVTDDSNCAGFGNCLTDWLFEPEAASLDLDGKNWDSSSSRVRVFYADVTSLVNFMNSGDILTVDIESLLGDFMVLKSWVYVDYNVATTTGGTGPTASVPEPGAGLCFLIGGLIVSTRLRRLRIS